MNIFLLPLLSNSITPYYFNPKIHNFGNIGIGGKFHANLATLSTKIIDNIRYNGKNIRYDILKKNINNNEIILDLCCGVGISTPENCIGVDTSIEMINVAKNNYPNKKFYIGNAENFNINKKIDTVTCMFAFHEMPLQGQINVKKNMEKIAKKEICIVDISSSYIPKKLMLSGEPYLSDYLNNIDNLFIDYDKEILIKNHVSIWRKYITC